MFEGYARTAYPSCSTSLLANLVAIAGRCGTDPTRIVRNACGTCKQCHPPEDVIAVQTPLLHDGERDTQAMAEHSSVTCEQYRSHDKR